MPFYFKVQDGLELQNDRVIVDGSLNPRDSGYAAPQGSIYMQDDGTIWRKYGAADINWSRLEIIVEGNAAGVDPAAGYTVDQVVVDDYDAIKWFLVVKSATTTGNRRAFEVYALNDDGTTVDYTAYAVLKTNTKPAGLEVSVDIDAGNMRLRIDGSENMDVSWVRLPIYDALS